MSDVAKGLHTNQVRRQVHLDAVRDQKKASLRANRANEQAEFEDNVVARDRVGLISAGD